MISPQAQARDRLGRLTTFTYNAAQQLVSVRDPLGRVTSFDRCGCGSLEALVDANGNRTRWDRDVEGRVTAETRADGSATHYTYETTTPRLKQVTDRKAQVTTYSYFPDDSFKQKVYTNAAVTTPTVSVTYDPTYLRLATMTDGTGTTTYSYNAVNAQLGAGQLASIDGPLTNDTISYTYDELGRVVSRGINGVSQSVTYDALARVTNVTNVLGSFTYGYVGNSGRLSSVAYPNGQTSTYSYFSHTGDDRLQTILHQRADSSTISRFDYTYDTAGNIASWTRQFHSAAPTVYQFGYDPANQILAATKQTTGGTPTALGRYRYAYDPAGNRTSEQIDDAVVGASYNNLNQLVSTQPSGGLYFAGAVNEPANLTIAGKLANVAADGSFSGTAPVTTGTNTVAIAATDVSGNTATKSYQVNVSGSNSTLMYDANGNLRSDGTRTFTWDAKNRLSSVTIGLHASSFTYDGLDRRVRIVEAENGSTTSDTRFVWCGLAICEARDTSGATVTKRYFAQGVQDGGAAYFYTADHLGSIRELIDGAGVVRARYDYDPWGRPSKLTGDKESDWGFTGHYQHGPSNLLLTAYRAYDSASGQWLSEDPLGLGGGPNLHAYVDGNPINLMDPLGLSWKTFGLGFFEGAAVGAAFVGATLLFPAAATALMIIGVAATAYGLYQLSNSWGCLSRDQKDQIVGGVIGGMVGGLAAGAIVPRAGTVPVAAEEEVITVTHFTDASTVAEIQNGTGTLNATTFVTLPSEVEGMNASQVEAALEIDPGQGAYSTTFQTPRSNLGPAFNGPLTSGQKIQFQLINPTRPGPFVPTAN